MSYRTPAAIAEFTAEAGQKKAQMPLTATLVLGFLAGAFIALGFLLDIRVIGALPKDWGSFGSFLGASVFPVGLVLVVIAGGELLTGNMMAVPLAWLRGRIGLWAATRNLLLVTLANFAGAVFVAYCFGHLLGLTETGPFLTKTIDLAKHKLSDNFLQAVISGIGCNWLVALAVWLAYAADGIAGKILGIWFPTMAFVAIGFQHVVANMFLIPAAIFAGEATWGDWAVNAVPVWIGNLIGGAIFVAGAYYLSYLRSAAKPRSDTAKSPATPGRSESELDAK